MGFNWTEYDSRGQDSSAPNNLDGNKWVEATIPVTGTVFHVSGASPQSVGPLTGNVLYVVTCYERAHWLATSGSSVSASRSDMAWEAGAPLYHIVISGSTDYISGYADDGGTIEYWVSKTEF